MKPAKWFNRADEEFRKALEEQMTAPQDRLERPIEQPTNPNYKPLDAAEFARLLAEERAKKAGSDASA